MSEQPLFKSSVRAELRAQKTASTGWLSVFSEPHQRTILLLGNTHAAVILARALKREGYALVCGVEGDEGGAEHSRDVDELWAHRSVESDPSGFLRDLETLLHERPEISVVYPTSQGFLQALTRHHHRLPAGPVYAMPPAHLVNSAFDKLNLLSLAVLNKVPIAPFEVVETPAGLFQAVERLGLPLVVQPANSGGPGTPTLCETLADLQAVILSLSGGMQPLVLWGKGKGRRHRVYFAAQDGQLVRFAQAAIMRTAHAGGWGGALEGKTVQPSRNVRLGLERLTGAMRYTGTGCAEFLVNERDGTACFVNLTPHIPADLAVPEASGLKLSTLAIALAQHPDDPVPRREGAVGLHYVAGASDLGTATCLSRIYRAVVASLRADIHLLWSWRDPFPGFFALTEILPSFVGAIGGRAYGTKAWHGS